MNALRLLLLFGTALGTPVQAQLRVPPSYPGASLTAIGGVLHGGGAAHRLWYFQTTDAWAAVLRHFQSSWSEEGLPVTIEGGPDAAVASAVDTRNGLQHAVVLSAHGDRTLVFQVVRDLWSLADETPAASVERLPRLEGTLFAEEAVEPGRRGRTRSAILRQSLTKTRDQVRKVMKASGFVQRRERREHAKEGSLIVLEHERGRLTLVSTMQALAPDATALFQSLSDSETLP